MVAGDFVTNASFGLAPALVILSGFRAAGEFNMLFMVDKKQLLATWLASNMTN